MHAETRGCKSREGRRLALVGCSSRRGSRERTTLATTGLGLGLAPPASGLDVAAAAASCHARETTVGHFMSHTGRSAARVSRCFTSSAISALSVVLRRVRFVTERNLLDWGGSCDEGGYHGSTVGWGGPAKEGEDRGQEAASAREIGGTHTRQDHK